jgi:hypothetical protein
MNRLHVVVLLLAGMSLLAANASFAQAPHKVHHRHHHHHHHKHHVTH